MATMLHSTAVVHSKAELADDVEVGPYAVIGRHVTIGEGTRIGPHAVIDGKTTIGSHNAIFASAQVGTPSQALAWNRQPNTLIIGNHNTIREFCTINPASISQGCTRIGDYNLLMANVHIAHDCTLANHIIMANMASLAGFVQVEDEAVIGGLTGIHQFCRIGAMSMIGGCSKITKDVMPFSRVDGNPVRCYGVNSVGLQRRTIVPETIAVLKRCFKLLIRSKYNTSQALELIEADAALSSCEEVQLLVSFIRGSQRGVVK